MSEQVPLVGFDWAILLVAEIGGKVVVQGRLEAFDGEAYRTVDGIGQGEDAVSAAVAAFHQAVAITVESRGETA